MENITNKTLKKRILQISHKYHLSHLGSNLTAVDIIDEIYKTKKPNEKFVLSAGHAHLAHLIVLAKQEMDQVKNDPKYPSSIVEKNYLRRIGQYGIHCDRQAGCDVSTGSLGHGLPIAVGMALADRSKDVYCLISDGECSEGSIWEALRIKNEQTLHNLHIYVNANGWGAYKEININTLYYAQILGFTGVNFRETNCNYLPFLKGQDAHYHVMTDEEFEEGMRILNV